MVWYFYFVCVGAQRGSVFEFVGVRVCTMYVCLLNFTDVLLQNCLVLQIFQINMPIKSGESSVE